MEQMPVEGIPCDVALVLETHCVACHGAVPSNMAPISLVSPADFQVDRLGQTAGQASVIRVQNDIRPMPPEPLPRLTPDEIAILTNWVEAGAPVVSDGCVVGDPSGPMGSGGASALGSGGANSAGGALGTGGGMPPGAGGAAGATGSGGAGGGAGGAGGASGAAGAGGEATGGSPPVGVRDDWPSYGADPANSRDNPGESTLGPGNVSGLRRLWELPTAGGTFASTTSTPAVVDGVVYQAAWDGKVHARNVADGSEVWTAAAPNLIDSSPTVTATRVYVSDNAGLVSAIDRASGQVLWSQPAETVGLPHLWSSPIFIEDANLLVLGVASEEESAAASYAFTFRGSVVGMDADTGAVRWRFYTTDATGTAGTGVGLWGSAAVDTTRKLVFIGTGNAYNAPAGPYSDALLAVNYETGNLAWHYQFTADDVFIVNRIGGTQGPDSDVGSTPNLFTAAGQDRVGVGVKNGIYYTFERETGALAWSHQISTGGVLGGVMSASAYASGSIFVAGNESMRQTTLKCLSAEDGSERWAQSFPTTTYAGLAHANGVVYLATLASVFSGSPSTIHAVDAGTGATLWSDTLPASAGAGPTVADGKLFVPWGFQFTLTKAAPGSGGLIVYGL